MFGGFDYSAARAELAETGISRQVEASTRADLRGRVTSRDPGAVRTSCGVVTGASAPSSTSESEVAWK
jgi:hypothetical protein